MPDQPELTLFTNCEFPVERAVKRCNECRQRKAIGEFSVKSNLPSGYNTRCRDCVNNVETLRRWGITYPELQALYGTVCNICGLEESCTDPRTGRVHRLAIDHDHRCCEGETGCLQCIRGLLCRTCNYRLGVLEANPAWHESARTYLDRSASRRTVS